MYTQNKVSVLIFNGFAFIVISDMKPPHSKQNVENRQRIIILRGDFMSKIGKWSSRIWSTDGKGSDIFFKNGLAVSNLYKSFFCRGWICFK